MIGEALTFLKNHLNAQLRAQAGALPGDSDEDKVVFIDGDKTEPITFKLGAVTLLLINIEEEKVMRQADPYLRVSGDGTTYRGQPDILMHLYVLFVARFKQYDHGLSYLSRIIQHFQTNRVLDHQRAPALSPRIEKLIMELRTMPFSEQNEVWNSLRTTYLPSVLYRVKMLAFRDKDVIRLPIADAPSAGVNS